MSLKAGALIAVAIFVAALASSCGAPPDDEAAPPPAVEETQQAVFTPFGGEDPPEPTIFGSSDVQGICAAWFGVCVNGSQGCSKGPVITFSNCLNACYRDYLYCLFVGGHK